MTGRGREGEGRRGGEGWRVEEERKRSWGRRLEKESLEKENDAELIFLLSLEHSYTWAYVRLYVRCIRYDHEGGRDSRVLHESLFLESKNH